MISWVLKRAIQPHKLRQFVVSSLQLAVCLKPSLSLSTCTKFYKSSGNILFCFAEYISVFVHFYKGPISRQSLFVCTGVELPSTTNSGLAKTYPTGNQIKKYYTPKSSCQMLSPTNFGLFQKRLGIKKTILTKLTSSRRMVSFPYCSL